jgi:hypothetical protein
MPMTSSTLPTAITPALSLGDVPVEMRANLAPSSIEVHSNLAEDSVIGGVMDIAVGVNKVAMFANPFVEGSEEMLYIDESRVLRWARHVNPPGPGSEPAPLEGWSVDKVAAGMVEVVVAVHPTGSLWAFALFEEPAGKRQLGLYELVADDTVLGGLRWRMEGVLLPHGTLSGLQVQYCQDRPATPFVFVTDPDEPRLFWFSPVYPAGGVGPAWHRGGEFPYDAADRGARVVAGVDSPSEEFSQRPVVNAVRLWSLVDGELYLTSCFPREGDQFYRGRIGSLGGWSQLVGIWTRSTRAGVVVAAKAGPGGQAYLGLAMPEMMTGVPLVSLDAELDDLVVWQDQASLLHLYGRDSQARLCVVHQLGWESQDSLPGLTMPVFDVHEGDGGSDVATVRPLVGQVASFAVDAFPDELPSQHVMHQGVPAGESCAIYTQSVRTSFWCREQVRLVPDALPKPYAVPRYQTSLVVKDGYGSPMAGVQVSLTADSPVDLEVADRFYRTGAITPVTLTTDVRGQITLRVVATGLSVPQLYATTPGLGQAVSVQMAADVHKFLGGSGSLPRHGDGFTAETVETAQNADGGPLFPKLRKGEAPGPWPPSAEDVVAWCAGAFAVDAGTALPPAMLEGLGVDQQPLAFTLQTHDPERPGFEVYADHDQLAARERALAAKGGVLSPLEDWVGDVWQGIRHDVVEIGEVFIDAVDRAIEIVITLADGVVQRLRAGWDDIVTAAHAIEAAVVAIGAKLSELVDWLKWAFDFKDALLTAQAMRGAIRQIPLLLDPVVKDYQKLAHGWFVGKEVEVKAAFGHLKQSLGGFSVSGLETPLASPTQTRLPAQAAVGDQVNSPHLSWLTEKVSATPDPETLLVPEGLGDLLDELWEVLTSAGAFEELEKAMDGVGRLFSNLFDGGDAQTVVAKELVTLLDIMEHVVLAGLTYADEVVAGLLTWALKALAKIVAILDTPLGDVPIVKALWDFLVEESGLPAHDHPLTLGGLSTLVFAYPATLLYKLVEGEAPFPGGTLPAGWSAGGPTATEPSAERAVDAVAVQRLHIFVGVLRCLSAPWDVLINLNSVNPVTHHLRSGGAEQLRATIPYGPSAIMARSAAVLRLFTWGVGDAPWLNGLPDAGPSVRGTRWGVLTLQAAANVIVAAVTGSTLERYKVGENMLPCIQGAGLTSMTSVFALVLAPLEWSRLPETCWYDTKVMTADVAGTIPLATAFVRAINDAAGAPQTRFLVLGKLFVDVGSDIYWGGTQIANASYELRNPVKFVGAAPRVFEPGTVGAAYLSEAIDIIGGFPGYAWSVLEVAGETGLPPGLELSLSGNTDYPHHRCVLTGNPNKAGAYTFTLRVTDNYRGPVVPADVHCVLLVKEE